jgi:hypothetical protein
MSNPWLKKNPWLSLWLSGANTVAGHVRSQATAEANRAAQRGMQDAMDFWTKAWLSPTAPKPPTRRRKR